MDKAKEKQINRGRRHRRIRARVSGTGARPRLSIYRSNRYLFAQLIDDEKQETLLAISSKAIAGKTQNEKAVALGKEIARKAKEKKITSVVFDRGGFAYTGKVESFADAARSNGLVF